MRHSTVRWNSVLSLTALFTTVLGATACLVGDEEDAEDPGILAAQAMGLGGRPIKAVKWWNPLVPDVNERAVTEGLELPNGMTYRDAAKQICALGIEAVFVRHAEPKIMSWDGSHDDPCDGLLDPQCRVKIDNRLADALAAIRDEPTCVHKPAVYIMQRQQLWSSDKIDSFANVEIKELIDRLEARGVKSMVKGLAIVETHVDGSCAVKNRAIELAQKVNAANHGFLKNRALFVGGQGLGNRFKNINASDSCRGLRSTFTKLAEETGSFSWIYKHFDKGETCSDWSILRNPRNPISKADAKKYLLDGCPGLRDLIAGLSANKAEFPDHANVTFWGDDGDGVTNIQPNVLAALHEIFVDDRTSPNFEHAVFDRLFVATATGAAACPQNEDHCKHLVVIDGAKNASFNTATSPGLPANVRDTWLHW